ncbi:hypothetical protein MKX01_005070 [Papaver californicum]|nr:hypothetical protein MKX01_005070 [Papaver californicum]
MGYSSTTAVFLLLVVIPLSTAVLDSHYYDQTCPQAEHIISETIRNASLYDPKVPARLLRMFFHDCFVRVCIHMNFFVFLYSYSPSPIFFCLFILNLCDASILLDSTPGNKAEKDGPPNISIRSFYVIEQAKAELEKACPRTVSCADIIAIAARDVVTQSGGPKWDVLKGRKDGKISKASETTANLPSPSFNITQLIQSFARRGLEIKDLVALSGGHTLGFSHCSSFQSRLRSFTSTLDVDPTLNAKFAESLRKTCPQHNRSPSSGTFLDTTSSKFDNDYYKQIVSGKGVTKWIVESFARDEWFFFKEFVGSMVKLGNVGVKSTVGDGEVRLKCSVFNSS